jgi:hypothetical protein
VTVMAPALVPGLALVPASGWVLAPGQAGPG